MKAKRFLSSYGVSAMGTSGWSGERNKQMKSPNFKAGVSHGPSPGHGCHLFPEEVHFHWISVLKKKKNYVMSVVK